MKKRRIRGTGGAKMRVIHQSRPVSWLFVQETTQKEVCIVIQKFYKPSSSPKYEVDCIEFQNKFGIMPCRK